MTAERRACSGKSESRPPARGPAGAGARAAGEKQPRGVGGVAAALGEEGSRTEWSFAVPAAQPWRAPGVVPVPTQSSEAGRAALLPVTPLLHQPCPWLAVLSVFSGDQCLTVLKCSPFFGHVHDMQKLRIRPVP